MNLLLRLFSGSLNISSDSKWAPDADTVAGTGNYGTSSSSLWNNNGIRIADNNILYVADQENDRVVVIQPGSNDAIAIIGSSGNGSNQLSSPRDVFVTSTSIYIFDKRNYRIQMWPKNGSSGTTVAGTTGVPGNSTSLIGPLGEGIFVDRNGYLYVSDTENNRVLRFSPYSTSGTSGVIVAGTGISGSSSSQLNNPVKMFVDDDLSIFIADRYNHRIQKWAYGACSGATVAGNGISGSSLSQLSFPAQVIVDVNGFMFIVEASNRRVLRWLVGASTGECIARCSGTSGNRPDQLDTPLSVAFDSNGLLYISDSNNYRVQKFSLLSTSSEYSTFSDTTVGVLEIVHTFCLFSTTGSIAHGTMDAVSDHRRRIVDGCFRKWIFRAVSQPGLADGRQQHALHRR